MYEDNVRMEVCSSSFFTYSRSEESPIPDVQGRSQLVQQKRQQQPPVLPPSHFTIFLPVIHALPLFLSRSVLHVSLPSTFVPSPLSPTLPPFPPSVPPGCLTPNPPPCPLFPLPPFPLPPLHPSIPVKVVDQWVVSCRIIHSAAIIEPWPNLSWNLSLALSPSFFHFLSIFFLDFQLCNITTTTETLWFGGLPMLDFVICLNS